MEHTSEGLTLWYGTADAPAPPEEVYSDTPVSLLLGVRPASINNVVEVYYRVDMGPTRTVRAVAVQEDRAQGTQYFRAVFPYIPPGASVGYVPVLTCAGQRVEAAKDGVSPSSFKISRPSPSDNALKRDAGEPALNRFTGESMAGARHEHREEQRQENNRMQPATHAGNVMQQAVKLAADGELGNSNAIRLLEIPHSPEDLRQVLTRFDLQLTPQARGKLAREVLAPLPEGVENQRYEPIFDRYPISGRTYTTASGTVVLNEVQYYNGKMVQLYGDCTNVEQVRAALSGSGYKPMTLKYANGQETTLAQFWAHNLSDTSLKPYDAMFIIVPAVRDDVPAREASIRADENGASSVLSAFDFSDCADKGVYENKARFFYVRLLDSTQIAIEVGRERMGTDKRFGTIRLTHDGQQLGFLVMDGTGKVVSSSRVALTNDPTAYRPAIAKAAATAGIRLGEYPPGSEYVFPGLARIGNGPVLQWQWRTDVQPQFQPVAPNTIGFDPASEEGAMLHSWGFQPRVLGFIPNVRGVVTGIPEP